MVDRSARIPTDLRWDVWERDDFRCVRCGARRRLTVDHVEPVALGGATTVDNLQTLCHSCNSKKWANVHVPVEAVMDPDAWLTVEQAATRLQLHIDTIRRALRSGELKGYRLGRKAGWRIRAGEVDRYVMERNGKEAVKPTDPARPTAGGV